MKSKHWSMFLVVMFLFSFSLPAIAGMFEDDGSEIGFSTHARWRGEADGRDFDSDTGMGAYSVLRLRSAMTFARDDVFVKFQVQYPNQIGWNSSNLATDNRVDVHQAYIKAYNFLVDKVSLKIGRMEMKYGAERLVGAVDWSNVGRVFDGFRLRYGCENIKADVFFTKQVERTPAGVETKEPDDNFYGLWIKYKPINFNVFAFHNSAAALDNYNVFHTNFNRTTAGIHYKNHYESGFGTMVEAAYQMGTKRDFDPVDGMVDTDIAAWMAVLAVWYQMESSLNPAIMAGIDMTSGDDPESEDKCEDFDNLYYTGHKWRGHMDYFLLSNPEGLQDIFVGVKLKPSDVFGCGLTFHNFATSQDYTYMDENNVEQESTSLGMEVDADMWYKVKDNMKFKAGLGYFMPSEDWVGKDKDAGLWGYMMLVTKFNLVR